MKHTTYTTDCMRRIKDPETGELRIARMVEERPVSVEFQRKDGVRYWKGARSRS